MYHALRISTFFDNIDAAKDTESMIWDDSHRIPIQTVGNFPQTGLILYDQGVPDCDSLNFLLNFPLQGKYLPNLFRT